jgi:hypothetical protein
MLLSLVNIFPPLISRQLRRRCVLDPPVHEHPRGQLRDHLDENAQILQKYSSNDAYHRGHHALPAPHGQLHAVVSGHFFRLCLRTLAGVRQALPSVCFCNTLIRYGDCIARFKDATSSFYSMYRVLVGDFDFTEMYQNNRIVGPVFLLLWTMVGLTVLFNVFVAILMESYEATKTDAVGFADMLSASIEPLMQKMAAMMKRLSRQANDLEDAPQDDSGGLNQLQSVDASSHASSRRLKREKKADQDSNVREVCSWDDLRGVLYFFVFFSFVLSNYYLLPFDA